MGCCSAKSNTVEESALQPQGKPAASKKAAAPPAAVIAKKVSQAASTRVLALRECGLKQLPQGATGPEMASVRTVDLSINNLKSLPEACSVWAGGLQTLLCSQNALTELPATIGQLAGLQKFVLSQNQLRGLPVELSSLGKLKTLQLDNNCLGKGSVPAGIFGGAMSSTLEELDLSGNALEDLPETVAELKALQRLLVARNRLRELPIGMGGLAKLQHLDASENAIPALPDGFLVGLSSLSELWLKGNPMDRLKLKEAAGFDAFMERRKQRLDAKITANVIGRVDLAVCGLD